MVGKILLSTWGVDQGYGVRWLADVRRDDWCSTLGTTDVLVKLVAASLLSRGLYSFSWVLTQYRIFTDHTYKHYAESQSANPRQISRVVIKDAVVPASDGTRLVVAIGDQIEKVSHRRPGSHPIQSRLSSRADRPSIHKDWPRWCTGWHTESPASLLFQIILAGRRLAPCAALG